MICYQLDLFFCFYAFFAYVCIPNFNTLFLIKISLLGNEIVRRYQFNFFCNNFFFSFKLLSPFALERFASLAIFDGTESVTSSSPLSSAYFLKLASL